MSENIKPGHIEYKATGNIRYVLYVELKHCFDKKCDHSVIYNFKSEKEYKMFLDLIHIFEEGGFFT